MLKLITLAVLFFGFGSLVCVLILIIKNSVDLYLKGNWEIALVSFFVFMFFYLLFILGVAIYLKYILDR